jgi:hypothetical protein
MVCISDLWNNLVAAGDVFSYAAPKKQKGSGIDDKHGG